VPSHRAPSATRHLWTGLAAGQQSGAWGRLPKAAHLHWVRSATVKPISSYITRATGMSRRASTALCESTAPRLYFLCHSRPADRAYWNEEALRILQSGYCQPWMPLATRWLTPASRGQGESHQACHHLIRRLFHKRAPGSRRGLQQA
jgi:hypothetical protein